MFCWIAYFCLFQSSTYIISVVCMKCHCTFANLCATLFCTSCGLNPFLTNGPWKESHAKNKIQEKRHPWHRRVLCSKWTRTMEKILAKLKRIRWRQNKELPWVGFGCTWPLLWTEFRLWFIQQLPFSLSSILYCNIPILSLAAKLSRSFEISWLVHAFQQKTVYAWKQILLITQLLQSQTDRWINKFLSRVCSSAAALKKLLSEVFVFFLKLKNQIHWLKHSRLPGRTFLGIGRYFAGTVAETPQTPPTFL